MALWLARDEWKVEVKVKGFIAVKNEDLLLWKTIIWTTEFGIHLNHLSEMMMKTVAVEWKKKPTDGETDYYYVLEALIKEKQEMFKMNFDGQRLIKFWIISYEGVRLLLERLFNCHVTRRTRMWMVVNRMISDDVVSMMMETGKKARTEEEITPPEQLD